MPIFAGKLAAYTRSTQRRRRKSGGLHLHVFQPSRTHCMEDHGCRARRSLESDHQTFCPYRRCSRLPRRDEYRRQPELPVRTCLGTALGERRLCKGWRAPCVSLRLRRIQLQLDRWQRRLSGAASLGQESRLHRNISDDGLAANVSVQHRVFSGPQPAWTLALAGLPR